jgi:hypothetical protein
MKKTKNKQEVTFVRYLCHLVIQKIIYSIGTMRIYSDSTSFDQKPNDFDHQLDIFQSNEDFSDVSFSDNELFDEDSSESRGINSSTENLSKVCSKRKRISSNSSENEHHFIRRKPRLLLRDQRRFYCDMIANVLNSSDFCLLFRMYETFCTPNATQKTFSCGVDSNQSAFYLTGASAMSKFWYSMFQLGPDSTVKVFNTNVHMSSETNCSKIVTNFTFSTTKIFKVKNVWTLFADHNQQLIDESVSYYQPTDQDLVPFLPNKLTNSTSNDEIKTLQNTITQATNRLTLTEKPFEVIVQGTYTLLTNENKLIYHMEVESHDILINYKQV